MRGGGATRSRLPDGRWHLLHGPIELVIGADGDPSAVARADEALWGRFQSVLQRLVDELPQLRMDVTHCGALFGPVARRMAAAAWPHRLGFITPMAAVAGAVADELIEPFRRESAIRRAYVNNGGDIALHLGPGAAYRVGLFSDLGLLRGRGLEALGSLDGDFPIDSGLPVRGIATSGWRGRSFSLGIADSVTVLARDGATADAAATVIANAVNVSDPRVERRPADELADETDLGARLVTVDVPRLERASVVAALEAGASCAGRLVRDGLVWGAILALQGAYRVVGGCTAASTLHSRLPRAALVEGSAHR